MNWRSGVMAGLVAAIVMSFLMALARMAGIAVTFERMIGTRLVGVQGPVAWITGIVAFIALYALVGLLYAVVLRRMRRGPRLPSGVMLGVVHMFLALIALFLLPPTSPGALLLEMRTLGVVVFLALHVLYGAIVGSILAPMARGQVTLPEVAETPA